MNFYKNIIVIGVLSLSILSCKDNDENVINPKPIPPVEEVKPLENAVLLLTSKEGWNDGARSFYRGHIMALQQDGSLVQDVFEKANSELKEKLLGFNAKALTVKNGKVYVLSTKGHNDQAPQIYVLSNENLKIEKVINIDPLVEEGIPTTLEWFHVVSESKAYLFFYGSVFSLDLATGKLGKKLDNIDSYSRITYPLFDFEGKVYAISYDDMERSVFAINPSTDAVSYEALGGDDKAPMIVKRDGNNLISLNKDLYGGSWNLSKISLKTKKAIQTVDIPQKVGMTAALQAEESLIFFNGAYDETNKENEEKTIFRFNYETGKLDKFAELKTNSPKSTIYNMRLFINPITAKMVVGVLDDVMLKFIRVYDLKATEFPVNYEKEYLYDNKCMGITEIMMNVTELE